jgi:hypothetical protein
LQESVQLLNLIQFLFESSRMPFDRKFSLLWPLFSAVILLCILLSPAHAQSQLVHDGSFELPLLSVAGSDTWTVCHGDPDMQVLDGNGTGIFGVRTPAMRGQRYLGMLDTDFESRESVGQAIAIEAGVHHYGTVALFRATAHHSWNGTGQLQLWGGESCSQMHELLWSSGTVSNADAWQYYPIQFASMTHHAWLSLVVVLDAGSGEMTYLCMDDLQLSKNFLAVNFISFDAQPAANAMQLTWETASLVDAQTFGIEWSADGRAFTQVGTVAGQAGQSNFAFEHFPSSQGLQYYRIKAIDQGGHETLSEIRQVAWLHDALQVYPNPILLGANAGQVHVSIPATQAPVSSLRLLDLQGRIVTEMEGPLAGQVVLSLPPQLSPGCYELQVMARGSILRHRVLVQR